MSMVRRALIGVALSVLLHTILYDAYAVWRFAPSRETTAGKRVLITGSSKGIGRELAALYSELGAHVTLHGRNAEALAEVSKECEQKGAASVHIAVGDMAKIGDEARTVRAAAEAMGGLDIVIVNHISPYVFETLTSVADRIGSGKIQRDLQVDLISYVEAAAAAVPLLEATSGSLVLVSSAVARLPMPYVYEYGMAKRGLEGLAIVMRQELALNGSSVHVGISCLGLIDTASAREARPAQLFRTQSYFAPTRGAAVSIAAVAQGRLRELIFPWFTKPFVLTAGLLPGTIEIAMRQSMEKL